MPQDVSITSFSISQFLWPCARAHRSTALGCRYSRATWSILPLTRIITFENQSPGEGVTPYNRLYGKARPRKGYHFQASGVWRCTVRISPVYLNYKRVENLSIRSVKKHKNANGYILWLPKSRLFTVPYFWVTSSRSIERFALLRAAILDECQNYLGGEGPWRGAVCDQSSQKIENMF